MSKLVKIPKRVAGMKIPKAIRKGPIIDFINTPAGQLVLAQTLIAIGGWYAAKEGTDPDSRTGEALRHPIDAVRSLNTDEMRERLARAFAEAARTFRSVMEEASDTDGPVEAEAQPTEEAQGKKSRVRSDARPH
ncbi:MAG: hypothetical protein ACJ8MR_17225 [Povalibacter sp.]